MGFSISDSDTLKAEMEKQLNKLDSYGQNIDIIVKITGKNGKSLSFKTGWMTYPDGKRVLSTPYGGKIK